MIFLLGNRVLCIVPINTLQNWMAEFNRWMPPPEDLVECPERQHFRARNFKIHLLNDALKTLEQRFNVSDCWIFMGSLWPSGHSIWL